MVLKRTWMVLLLGFLFCPPVQNAVGAAELKGKVTAVNGSKVQIQLDGDLLPRVGDPVTIGFKVPGLGLVTLEGQWQVSFTGTAVVEAEPSGTAPQPQVGQLVSIQSAQPGSAPAPASNAAETAFNRGEDYFHGRNGVAQDYGAQAHWDSSMSHSSRSRAHNFFRPSSRVYTSSAFSKSVRASDLKREADTISGASCAACLADSLKPG